MAKLNIKKGDKVLVITGKDTGKTAEVLSCFPEENKVVVKGLNIIVKHNKPRSAQDKGGIVKKEGKIPASNVMVVCPTCGKATRVSYEIDEKGKKIRVCKKDGCGASLDNVKRSANKKTTKETAPKTAETKKKEEVTSKKETAKTETKEVKVEKAKVETKKEEKAETAKKPTATKKTVEKAEKKTTSTKSAK